MNKFLFKGNIGKELNKLCREEMKEKLLKEILFDMQVCKLEGWDIFEYTKELINLLQNILSSKKGDEL